MVSCVQALVVAAAAVLLAAPVADAFQIEGGLRGDFIFLLSGHGLLLAFGFITKVVSMPFWGFQRYDVGNYAATAGFAMQMGVLWLGFAWGLGINTMLAAYAASTLLNFAWTLVAGFRLGVFPRRGAWGAVDRGTLRELFTFGRDVFLMAIGAQLLSASQIIIITRTLGLEAAATWAVCSKIFTLGQQFVSRIYDNSIGAFAEMYVRGERDRLRFRLGNVVALTAALGVAFGAVAAVGNGTFVALWTHGRVAWPPVNDLLFAIFVPVICVSRCHTGTSGVSKNLRVMRFVYFFEGLTFAILAMLVARPFGFAGIIGASIVATALWSGIFGHLQSRADLGCGGWELLGWIWPAAKTALVAAPGATALWYFTRDLPPGLRLGANLLAVGGFTAAGLWHAGLPESLRAELRLQWTRRFAFRRV